MIYSVSRDSSELSQSVIRAALQKSRKDVKSVSYSISVVLWFVCLFR